MDDIEYMYKQDLREKKSIAASAKHRKGKVIGPKGCRLPSDYLTKKERNAMNGPVTTYDLGKPVKFKEFKSWPTDIQKEYILRLDSLYQPTNIALGAMLGIHTNTAKNIRKVLGILVGRGGHRHFDEAGWNAFINGETAGSEVIEETVEPMDTDKHIEVPLRFLTSIRSLRVLRKFRP